MYSKNFSKFSESLSENFGRFTKKQFSLVITHFIVDLFLSIFQTFRKNWYQEDWWMNTSGRSKASLQKHTWSTLSKDPCLTRPFPWNKSPPIHVFLSIFQNILINYLYQHRHTDLLLHKSYFSCWNFVQYVSEETSFYYIFSYLLFCFLADILVLFNTLPFSKLFIQLAIKLHWLCYTDK